MQPTEEGEEGEEHTAPVERSGGDQIAGAEYVEAVGKPGGVLVSDVLGSGAVNDHSMRVPLLLQVAVEGLKVSGLRLPIGGLRNWEVVQRFNAAKCLHAQPLQAQGMVRQRGGVMDSWGLGRVSLVSAALTGSD